MDLKTIGFDLYQTGIISGIKFRALLSTLNEEQRKVYQETIQLEIAKIKEKLETHLTPEQSHAIMKELSEF